MATAEDRELLRQALRKQMILDMEDKKWRRANLLHDAIMALHELDECEEKLREYQ